PKLAKTFREIIGKGRDGFYKGYVAQSIVDLIQSKGGEMTLEDLEEHETTIVEPICFLYQRENLPSVRIWECPPNGQGLVALLSLGILQELQKQKKISLLEQYEHNSAEYLHILIESLRLAFADGRYFIHDPTFQQIPIENLLSESYLSKRTEHFQTTSINQNLKHGKPVNSSD
ncbi:unnamed protein product, partial [Adineta ricciae]